MRDLIAAIIALALLLVAVSLAATLRSHRRTRTRAYDLQHALGRWVIAEIPTAGDFILFSEDDQRFYYGELAIEKRLITAVRILINGSPIAAHLASGWPQAPTPGGEHKSTPATGRDERGESTRDRWAVVIETAPDGDAGPSRVLLIECGAIRERVSQELARAVFDAVKRTLEREATEAPSRPGTL
jgi:hypothetical protein